MRACRRGITVAEVLVAVTVLTIGVLALVGTSAQISRMIGRGRHATVAGVVAAARLNQLRTLAQSSSPPCSRPDRLNGSAVESGVTQSWQLLDPSGSVRRLRLVVSHRTAVGSRADTVESTLLCLPA